MKKLLLILSLALFGSSLCFGQTAIKEQYFHELKGMEDSAGTTHLFYREYIKKRHQCNEEFGGRIIHPRSDDVRHFNTITKQDSVKFYEYFEPWCIDYYTGNNSLSYTFFDHNPDKWFVQEGFDCYQGIRDHDDNFFSLLYGCLIKEAARKNNNSYFGDRLILSPNQDSLYINFSSELTIPLSVSPEYWPRISENDYQRFEIFLDSIGIQLNIINIHPHIDSLYFAVKSGDLYRSTQYSTDFNFADSSTYFRNIYFDADNSHIYSLTSSGLLRSDELGAKDSWELIDIDFQTNSSKFLSVDESISGNIFLSDSSDVLFSNDYGDNFSVLLSVENEVTGLYKKPDSNLLYVLARKELLEVNTDTKEATTLKTLPVSNEPEQNEIPTQVSLQQNYPNPFNPNTVISYQLTGNSLVRLEVFDVTGRKVAVLVNDEQKSAGTHQVTFNTGNLSSGVYLYRLETAGQTLTRKMLLVK